MRITVADPSRLSDGAHTEEVALEIAGDGIRAVQRILWIPLPSSFSAQNLDAFLQDAAPLWSLRPDACFLGLHPDCEIDDDVLDDVAGRIRDVPLFTVRLDGVTHNLAHVRGPSFRLDTVETLTALRQADLLSLLVHAGVHLPMDPAVHYKAPSGDHYSAFLRAGFSLRSMEDLDRVAFWLAPYFASRTHVLVDHWSMIGLAYHTLSYVDRLSGGSGKPGKVETLHRYTEGKELAQRLRRNFRGVGASGIALVSVTSTGFLALEVMAPAMRAAGHEDMRVIALAQPEGAPSEVPHLAELPRAFAPEDADCERCRDGDDVLLPVQRDSYLLALSAFSTLTAITATDAAEGKSLLSNYGGVGAFSVHRTHDDGRHHAYYANVLPMLNEPAFVQHLAERLSLMPRTFDVALAPDLPAARKFAELVAERVDIGRVIHADEREILRDAEVAELLATSTDVLYLDDVVITGRRLLGYRRAIVSALRRLGVGDHDLALHALVALARPRSRRSLQGIRDIVHHRPRNQRFFAVESLLLPHWDETHCPWCREERLLTNVQARGIASPEVRARLERLRKSGGLEDELFFDWPGTASAPFIEQAPSARLLERHGESGSWTLRQGSVFGDTQGADLAVSVASALQELRSTIGKNGEPRRSDLDDQFRSPISKVLDPALYVAGRYYEPVLVASILRASHSHDLNPPGQRDLEEALISEIGSIGEFSTLFGEVMLQIAEGKIATLPERVFTQQQRAHPLLRPFLAEADKRRREAPRSL